MAGTVSKRKPSVLRFVVLSVLSSYALVISIISTSFKLGIEQSLLEASSDADKGLPVLYDSHAPPPSFQHQPPNNHTISGINVNNTFAIKKQYEMPPQLPLYWISLDAISNEREEERLQRFQDAFRPIIRVPARKEQNTNTNDQQPDADMTRLLSHLTAIRQAYLDGHEQVLIVEDTTALDWGDASLFALHYPEYINLAPKNWGILQWKTSNQMISRHLQSIYQYHDAWITWQPEHTGTEAYLLNRNAMVQILNKTTYNTSMDLWSIKEHPPGLWRGTADEFLYYTAKGAYTSTYPWWQLQQHGSVEPTKTLLIPKMIARSEKVLVILSIRMESLESIHAEIEKLCVDYFAWSKWHNGTWAVNFVVTQRKLKKPLIDQLATMCPAREKRFQIHIQTNGAPFNKFRAVAKQIDTMSQYDYVLLKDADFRLAGFPWNAFMEKKSDALVSTALRDSTDESLISKEIALRRRSPHWFYYGQEWKMANLSWSRSIFETLSPIDVPMIEQSFALLQSDFSHWFFSKMLTEEFLSQRTDWGPGMLWCGAAHEYQKNKNSPAASTSTTPCYLVPVVILHDDTRQIQQSRRYKRNGNEMLTKLKENFEFQRWMVSAEEWKTLIDSSSLEMIEERCKSRSPLKPNQNFSLGSCSRSMFPGELYEILQQFLTM